MNIGAIGKKLGQLVIVILIVSFGTFVLASLIPGDPAVSVLGEGRTPAEYEEVRQQLGLNDPLLVRYWDWLTSALQGDLGNSLVPPQQDVLTAISSALPVSVQLAVMGLVIALVVAVPLALWSAHHEGGGHVGHGGEHVPVGGLRDRVAALEGGERRQLSLIHI